MAWYNHHAMRFRPRLLRLASLASAAALAGCLFSGDGDGDRPMTPATLAETGLVGLYDLVDFKVEYSDGNIIDTSKLKITGLLEVGADSAYTQRIWISQAPTDTRGRITGILAEQGNRKKGEVTLTLEGSSAQGESAFELRGDTLTWITEVAPGGAGKVGFKETGRYARHPQ
jgi:hypothetical protein